MVEGADDNNDSIASRQFILQKKYASIINSYKKNTKDSFWQNQSSKNFWKNFDRKNVLEKRIKTKNLEEMDANHCELLVKFKKYLNEMDFESILSLIKQSPQVASCADEKGQLPIHALCSLNFKENKKYFLPILTVIIQAFPEGCGHMDNDGKTSLHYLCSSSSICESSIALIVNTFDGVIAMSDKNSSIPLHHICLNKNITISMLNSLLTKYTASRKDKDNMTPLHKLCQNETISIQLLQQILKVYPQATTIKTKDGRLPFHFLCSNSSMNFQLFKSLLQENGKASTVSDFNGSTPLHYLCQNKLLKKSNLLHLLMASPTSLESIDLNGSTPLHNLCDNSRITLEMLQIILSTKEKAASYLDKQKSTPLHILCMNSSFNIEMVQMLLEAYPLACTLQDVYGQTPLHYACSNVSVNASILWVLLKQNNNTNCIIDKTGRTCLHYLCQNKAAISLDLLALLFETCPSASQVMDMNLKFPIQYLLETKSFSDSLLSVLVSNQSLYRTRYKIKEKGKFKSNSTSCCQDEAIDTTNSSEVLIKYFLQKELRDEEFLIFKKTNTPNKNSSYPLLSLKVVDQFDDANRRVSKTTNEKGIQAICPSVESFILQYALVIEKPKEMLNNLLRKSSQLDLLHIKGIISSIGQALANWHLNVKLVNGSVISSCIGQISDGTYRLFDHSRAKEIGKRMSSNHFDLYSYPPELGKSLLHGNQVELLAHPSLDLWQFGCLIYEMITSKPLLEELFPWIDKVDLKKVGYLLCSLSDHVIYQKLELLDKEIRDLLSKLLLVDPKKRWTIDRILGINGFPFMRNHYIAFYFEKKSEKEPNQGEEPNQKEESNQGEEPNQEAPNQEECAQLEYSQLERKEIISLLIESNKERKVLKQKKHQLEQQLEDINLHLSTIFDQNKRLEIQQTFEEKKSSLLRDQLDTTVRMLIQILPLAEKVYGKDADDFLANTMSIVAQFSSTQQQQEEPQEEPEQHKQQEQ